VKTTIETRELISVDAGGACLRGTYHRCSDDSPSAGAGNRVGVLFLNHGFLPRSAPGDSAAFWADSFASCGYPSFRFDLPGLGDSDGEVPAQMLDVVNAGGYAAVLSATLKELVERYRLSGMVIMGHCAGAVSALFTAAVSKECRGLILTDPYFFVPRERTKIREELSRWSSWSRLGALVSDVYYCLKYIRLLVRRNRPPRNANLALLGCWNQLVSAGLPMLVMKAPSFKANGIKPRLGEFDYLTYLQGMSGRSSRVVIKFIEGTDHSFADAVGRTAIRQHAERWLNTYFPTTGDADHQDLASHPLTLRVGRSLDRSIEAPQVLQLNTSSVTPKGGLTL